MITHGSLVKCDEALRFIETIPRSVTKNLVNMAFTHLVKEAHLKHRRPQTDVDMLFLVSCLSDFFDEHDILARTLQGEKVGAWFDEDTEPRKEDPPIRRIKLPD
jgi:hypothetical protein